MRIRFSRRYRKPLSPGKLMVVAPLIGLIMIGIVAVVGMTGTDLDRFVERSSLYDAHVVGTKQFRGRPGEHQSVEMMHYLRVRFTPPGGVVAYKDAEVLGATVERFRAASEAAPVPTKVYYNAAEPYRWHDIHELEREGSDGTVIKAGFLIFGFGLLALGFWAFTKWRRGETVMQRPVRDEPVSPEQIALLKHIGIPTMFLPGQEQELADLHARLHGRPASPPLGEWNQAPVNPDDALGGREDSEHRPPM